VGTPQYALIFVFPECPPLVTTWSSGWADLVQALKEWQAHDRAYERGKVSDEEYVGIVRWIREVGFEHVPDEDVKMADTVAHICLCPWRDALDYRLGRELVEWRVQL